MALFHRSTASLILLACLLLPLTSCANSGLGQALQNSLAADPKLKQAAPDGTLSLTGEQASPQPLPSAQPTATPSAQLPPDFPAEIPRYPGAVLQAVIPGGADGNGVAGQEVSTEWASLDSGDRILAFYKQELQSGNWKLDEIPLSAQQDTLTARQNGLQVTVSVQSNPTPASPGAPSPAATSATASNFTIQYIRSDSPAAQAPTVSFPTPSPSPQEQEVFLGVEGTSAGSAQAGATLTPATPNAYTDLDKTPKQLKQYVADLAQLGALSLSPYSAKEKANTNSIFAPNKPVSRREYARWLFDANNRLFADRAAQQIRAAESTTQPAFRDVPRSDPDFPVIQGLAEAGIIPSSLSGDPTAVTFRPDAQLSRETMLLWKVPIDTHQTLPTATLDAIKQTWAFQDAARIDPRAQRAVLADYQNGDLSNIHRVFGYTTLLQPKKAVTRAEAAATLWYFGYQGDGMSAQEALKGMKGEG